MFFELIATICFGFFGAGIAMLANRASGRRLPRWTIPVAAGACMIGITVWLEYGWYDRKTASLPEDVVIAWQNEDRQFYRPWTYLAPLTSRFTAVDLASLRTNDALPDQRMVDLYFVGRWSPNRRMRVVVDCADGRMAALEDGVDFGSDGALEGAAWSTLPGDDPVRETACRRG